MTLITRLDYELFIERYLMQDADKYGRLLRGELRRRITEWRGSNYRTYKSHRHALVDLGYLSDLGGYYQINEPIFSLVQKRMKDKSEKRDELALMQRHSIMGGVLAPEYGEEHKKVSDISDLIERMRKEEQVKRIDKALKFVDRGEDVSSVSAGLLPPLNPSGKDILPPPHKEAGK